MKTYLLLVSIKKRLEESLKDWKMSIPVKSGEDERYRTPSIYIGQLPKKEGSRPGVQSTPHRPDSDYPYVIIVLTDGEETAVGNERNNTISVGLVVGIHSAESHEEYEKGVESTLNITDRIVKTINDYRLWADDYYQHTAPVSYALGLPNSIDPYSTGLKAEAPYFAVVAQTKFERKSSSAQLDTMINHSVAGIPR